MNTPAPPLAAWAEEELIAAHPAAWRCWMNRGRCAEWNQPGARPQAVWPCGHETPRTGQSREGGSGTRGRAVLRGLLLA